jgi:hypothetical protein
MESTTNHTDDKDILPPKEAPTCTTATMPSSTTTRDATINGERAGAEADADGEVEVEGEGEEVPVSSRGEPKGPPGACLFVASLAPDTTESVLHIYFLQFGPILKVKLLKDKAARPYAFVQFMVRGVFGSNRSSCYYSMIADRFSAATAGCRRLDLVFSQVPYL